MPENENRFHFIIRRTLEKTRAGLTILFLFSFILIIDLLFLYIADLTFQARKKEMIGTTWKYRSIIDQFLDDVGKAFDQLAGIAPDALDKSRGQQVIKNLKNASPEEQERWLARLRQLISQPHSEFSAEHPIFMARIYSVPEHGEAGFESSILYVRDDAKFERLNNFENSFISRRFVGHIDSTLAYCEAEFAFTNPPDSSEIQALTWRYRGYGAGFVLMSFIVFLIMLRKVLLPMHRVAVELEHMQRRPAQTLHGGRTRVERAYNALARNTQLLQVGREIGAVVGLGQPGEEHGDPWLRMGEHAPGVIGRLLSFERVLLYSWGHPPRLMGCYGSSPPEDPLPAEFEEAAREKQPRFCASWNAWVAPICFNDQVHGLLVTSGPEAVSGGRGLSEGLADQIENILLRLSQQQILLDREKNEISINLCTNMGHDLTNVIATSKWDIDTVRRALEQQLVAMKEDRLAPLFAASVEGLLNNTRFLQEIVEIYRAFGYTKRPEYAATDVAALIQEVVDLFKLSTTRDYRFEVNLQEGMARANLEPRLMKLALFNLMTNASQAITRRLLNRDENTELGVIALSAEETDGELIIRVRDNGSGFRHANGELMNDLDMQRIFAYGFSTKDDKKSGTGIGLSWVRTIIEEYHKGRVIPRNVPDGGAEMSIRIPLL